VAGATVTGEFSRHQFRVFILTGNPVATVLLTAIAWRALSAGRDLLRTQGGLECVELSMAAASPWAEIAPIIGFRRELVVTGVAPQTISVPESYIRTLMTRIDQQSTTVVEFDLTRRAT